MRPAVALLALAALAWLLRPRDRPLPKPASTTEPEDDVQGPDPVTTRPAHVEGGPDCRWYSVRVTEELFEQMGSRVEWGQPDADGFYTPYVRNPVTTRPVVVTLPASLSPDEVGHIRTWLDDHPDVIEELYESSAIRTRPLGGM